MLKADAKKTASGRKSLRYFLVAFAIAAVSLTIILTQTNQPSKISEPNQTSYCLQISDTCAVELEPVQTPEALTKGLSGRDSLAENKGMLFIFDSPDQQCFWMKDMNFSIDMIFLDANKKVVRTFDNVSPESYPNNYCADDVKYVIEITAGKANGLGIENGQTLKF
jgi:uncharacterized membrane protein (UPF0127 family)